MEIIVQNKVGAICIDHNVWKYICDDDNDDGSAATSTMW